MSETTERANVPATREHTTEIPLAAVVGDIALLDAMASVINRLGVAQLQKPEVHGDIGLLVRAICGVMGRVKEVPKLGFNRHDKYPFVAWADLSALLQDAMVQEGLVIGMREMSRRIVGKILFISYQMDVFHTSGAYVFNMMGGTGACRFEFASKGTTDDKSALKAMTNALKGLSTALFKIPADPDPDIERTGNDEQPDWQRRDNAQRQVGQDRGDGRAWRGDDRRDPPDNRSRENDNRSRENDNRRDPPDNQRREEDRPRNDDRPRDAGFNDPPPNWPSDNPEPPPFGPPGEPPPPAESSAEADFRRNCENLQLALKDAPDLASARNIWAQNIDLFETMNDTTYNHFLTRYRDRWQEPPPQAAP